MGQGGQQLCPLLLPRPLLPQGGGQLLAQGVQGGQGGLELFDLGGLGEGGVQVPLGHPLAGQGDGLGVLGQDLGIVTGAPEGGQQDQGQ